VLLRLILVASKTKRIVLQAHINWKKSFKTDYVEVVLEADRCCVKEQFVTVFPSFLATSKGPTEEAIASSRIVLSFN